MSELKFCTSCRKNVYPENYSIDICLLIVLSAITFPLFCVGGIIYVIVHAASHKRCPDCHNKNLTSPVAETARETVHVVHHYEPAPETVRVVHHYEPAPNQPVYALPPDQKPQNSVRICSNCGAESSNGQFCAFCGSALK